MTNAPLPHRCTWFAVVATLMASIAFAATPPTGAGGPESDGRPNTSSDSRPDGPTLDTRIDPTKIGPAAPPPPLPEQILLPLPPSRRIATDHTQVPMSADHWRRAQDAIDRGIAYLVTAQDPSGGWLHETVSTPTPTTTTPAQTPGTAHTADPDARPDITPSPVSGAVTALIIKSVAQARPETMETPAMRRAMQYILSTAGPDGSYGAGSLSNYVTSTIVSALTTVDEFEHRDRIEAGVAWLQRSQWDHTEGLAEDTDWYGGAGYGRRGRPDLSNSQMMLEALYDAGLSPSEPAFERALTFLSRTQNLEATNPATWAGNDGGFVYTPAGGGESMASEYAGEGRYGEKLAPNSPRSLRSYGSMTYAGFKSLLYAGLSADDVRVRAAFDWIRRHWTFDENPGLGEQGLFYYYHAMSRALRVAQQHTITDLRGAKHNWREELVDAIMTRQRADGSWRNDAERWLEGNAELSTAYALLALEEAMKEAALMPNDMPSDMPSE